MNKFLLWAAVVASAAAAWAGDVAVASDAHVPPAAAALGTDAQLELGWDNGSARTAITWYTGEGYWVGNDFDLSTLSSYLAVEKLRFHSQSTWPNGQWDGFRVVIFDFSGSVPGMRLWPVSEPGYFFKPSAFHGMGWVEIPIGWTSPSTHLVPAIEQYYNFPNCDAYRVDTNNTFTGHSWQNSRGVWSYLSGIQGYRNLMLRLVVDDTTVGVAPASFGCVKALYR